MTITDFTAVINQLLPEPHAGLLNGILFGTKATLSRDLYDQLIKTGTLHIIALSGMNITILANLVSITLLRFVSRRIASLLTVLIIIGFILFVGPSASVVRAGIMGSLALLAVVFGRQTWSLFFLVVAAGSMLIVHPVWITDIGFQLSVLASLGIILFGKKLAQDKRRGVAYRFEHSHTQLLSAGPASRVSRIKTAAEVANENLDVSSVSLANKLTGSYGSSRRSQSEAPQNFVGSPQRSLFFLSPLFSLVKPLWSLIEDDLRVTLAAQVFTIPLIFLHFHRISLVSPLTNILIGWIIQPITVLGLVAVIAGWIFLPLGMLIGWMVWVPLQYMLWIIQLTSMLPFASLSL